MLADLKGSQFCLSIVLCVSFPVGTYIHAHRQTELIQTAVCCSCRCYECLTSLFLSPGFSLSPAQPHTVRAAAILRTAGSPPPVFPGVTGWWCFVGVCCVYVCRVCVCVYHVCVLTTRAGLCSFVRLLHWGVIYIAGWASFLQAILVVVVPTCVCLLPRPSLESLRACV